LVTALAPDPPIHQDRLVRRLPVDCCTPLASRCAGSADLRHTFATFARRAGISTFDLSRYIGASLTMIDRHYGHLARNGREHAIRLVDELSAGQRPR
jgi:hypothetical protein